jgi:homotetrameric cytidine deaminase
MAIKAAAVSKKESPEKTKFSKETYVKWYKDMLLIRKFEEKTGQLYIQQKFGGFCHLYIGQEAIVAGTASACRPSDKHMTAYRDHGHPIALGTDPRILMDELYGRSTGCSKGKGGSMHFFDKEKNFMGGHGIVGAAVLLENGLIIEGNNQENVAYPSGLCAERVALFYAGANYPNVKVDTICIVAKGDLLPKENLLTPCGGCRQVMIETENRQKQAFRTILVSQNNKVMIFESALDLLPFAFGVI